MSSNHWILETSRLGLRCLTSDDGAFVHRLLNEPSWLQYIGDRGVRTREDARDYIERGPVEMQRRLGFSLYLVEEKRSGDAVGICGLLKRETLADVEIGFAFLEEHQRRGYAFESASAVMSYAAHTLGIPRIVAITTLDNDVSAKVLAKLGFSFEQITRLTANAPEVKLYAASLVRHLA